MGRVERWWKKQQQQKKKEKEGGLFLLLFLLLLFLLSQPKNDARAGNVGARVHVRVGVHVCVKRVVEWVKGLLCLFRAPGVGDGETEEKENDCVCVCVCVCMCFHAQ